jgi:hypothetical protein
MGCICVARANILHQSLDFLYALSHFGGVWYGRYLADADGDGVRHVARHAGTA